MTVITDIKVTQKGEFGGKRTGDDKRKPPHFKSLCRQQTCTEFQLYYQKFDGVDASFWML